jgi:hypothetical protein
MRLATELNFFSHRKVMNSDEEDDAADEKDERRRKKANLAITE